MHIDWINFTPWQALFGGALIGLAATALILLNGRVAGISGILGGLLAANKSDIGWRIAFLLGLLLAPALYALHETPVIQIDAEYPVLIMAGLLVGLGTRYGAGCTSGHGVCGLSRRSARSFVATGAFMTAGFVTVYVVRHIAGA